jgi:ABC-type protease/lipase transport system fused ATPase/permease subunit
LPAIDHILILRDGIARLYGTRDEVLSRLEAPRSITPEQNHLENETEDQVKKIVQRQTADNNERAVKQVLAGAA